MGKSPDAFRTISEVAEWLGVQAHVLRFWESKFTQVKPIKRAGGRRYYRPNDMLLIGGIRKLLHEDGLTIKGVQKILRENGVAHVVALSQPLDEMTASQLAEMGQDAAVGAADNVVTLQHAGDAATAPEARAEEPVEVPLTPEPAQSELALPPSEETPTVEHRAEAPQAVEVEPATQATAETAPSEDIPAGMDEAPVAQEAQPAPPADLPAFLRRPMSEPEASEPSSDAQPRATAEELCEPEAETLSESAVPPAKPRIIDMPPITALDEVEARASALTKSHALKAVTAEQAAELTPILTRLTALRDAMIAGAHSSEAPDTSA
ncbi:MAG: MerR family transcriptional regulator [Pseudomonadota bacterium]